MRESFFGNKRARTVNRAIFLHYDRVLIAIEIWGTFNAHCKAFFRYGHAYTNDRAGMGCNGNAKRIGNTGHHAYTPSTWRNTNGGRLRNWPYCKDDTDQSDESAANNLAELLEAPKV